MKYVLHLNPYCRMLLSLLLSKHDKSFTMLSMVLFLCFLQVRLVRVTKRVHEAYFAQLYLTKADS